MRYTQHVLSACLLTACLLALAAIAPRPASARSLAQAAPCAVTADGWKGHVTGKKIKPTRPAVERRVVELVNRYRKQHGLRPLTLDPGLRYAARARGVIDESGEERLAQYSPSECIAESVVRREGVSRATSIMRTLRGDADSRHLLLQPWAKRIGVGVRVGTFKGERVTTATASLSAPRPKGANARDRPREARVRCQAAPPKPVAKPPIRSPTPSGSEPKPDPKPTTTPAKPKPPAKPAPPVVPPTAPAPPAPAPPPPVTPPAGGSVVGVPYTCNGPVNNLRIVGTGSHSRSLINLAAGCTGTLSFDIRVTAGGGDGVKVQGGVHDLVITESRIVCDRLDDTSFHQDGVQVQGGTNVTFSKLQHRLPVRDRDRVRPASTSTARTSAGSATSSATAATSSTCTTARCSPGRRRAAACATRSSTRAC